MPDSGDIRIPFYKRDPLRQILKSDGQPDNRAARKRFHKLGR